MKSFQAIHSHSKILLFFWRPKFNLKERLSVFNFVPWLIYFHYFKGVYKLFITYHFDDESFCIYGSRSSLPARELLRREWTWSRRSFSIPISTKISSGSRLCIKCFNVKFMYMYKKYEMFLSFEVKILIPTSSKGSKLTSLSCPWRLSYHGWSNTLE